MAYTLLEKVGSKFEVYADADQGSDAMLIVKYKGSFYCTDIFGSWNEEEMGFPLIDELDALAMTIDEDPDGDFNGIDYFKLGGSDIDQMKLAPDTRGSNQ